MSRDIPIMSLTAGAFAPFGDILDTTGSPDVMINQGKCGRYHDRAELEFDADGRAGISLFAGTPYPLPLALTMMERHPKGAQAFIPMDTQPFLVIVAPDADGSPGRPVAFCTDGAQGVNYHRNTWHAVLTPLKKPQTFAVVDRIGPGDNLEEYWFDEPYMIRDA